MPSCPSRRQRRLTRKVSGAPEAATRPAPCRPQPSSMSRTRPAAPSARRGGASRPVGRALRAVPPPLRAGTAITAAAVTLLAGAGVERLLVHRLPRIAVLATGDEGPALGEPPVPGAPPER